MRIHSLVSNSTVNGPGNRAVIWTQGCRLGCAGCWNPETWDFNAGQDYSIARLLQWIGSLKGIEGLTISGGEPMAQELPLCTLLHWTREFFPNLSIGMFTGYAELELGKFAMWPSIRHRLDFAVVGRYNALRPVQLPMVTSANQKLLIFRRYRPEDFTLPSVEVTISDTGQCVETGFPIHGDVV
jgi:anaerobic ribonucleoside-triphosphate reductase activating protein